MSNFWDWLRWISAQPAFQWVESWLFALLDAFLATIQNALRLNPPPPLFRSFQADQLPFDPPVIYPLKNHPGQKWPPHSPYDGKGTYTTAFATIRLSGSYIESILPKGLALQPTLIDALETYPVVLMFGYQQNLQRALNFSLPGVNYLEFAVAIPGLRRTDPNRLTTESDIPTRFIIVGGPDRQIDTADTTFVHVSRLYLNRFFPTLLGWVSGLPKVWADVSTTDNTFAVREKLSGKQLFKASFVRSGERGKIGDFPNAAALGNLIQQPVVNWFANKLFLYIYLDWGWDNAYLQPLTGTLEVFADGIPGLPKGSYTFESTEHPLGSFLAEVPWELVPPFLREQIPDKPELESQNPNAKSDAAAGSS